jgi:hypothetical protein
MGDARRVILQGDVDTTRVMYSRVLLHAQTAPPRVHVYHGTRRTAVPWLLFLAWSLIHPTPVVVLRECLPDCALSDDQRDFALSDDQCYRYVV